MKKLVLAFATFYLTITHAHAFLYATEANKLKDACKEKDGYACCKVGLAYERGDISPKSNSIALKYYTKSCELREAEGCYRLAMLYEFNELKIDSTKAKNLTEYYYDEACLLNNAYGCQRSAEINIEKGDLWAASRNYLRACKLNLDDGCARLADLYYDGKGVKGQSYAMARLYYQKACMLENSRACFNLGYIHLSGQGVEVSKRTATEFYKLACTLGHSEGCKMTERLTKANY